MGTDPVQKITKKLWGCPISLLPNPGLWVILSRILIRYKNGGAAHPTGRLLFWVYMSL